MADVMVTAVRISLGVSGRRHRRGGELRFVVGSVVVGDWRRGDRDYVFVSYAAPDLAVAEEIQRFLEGLGIATWHDRSSGRTTVGEPLPEELGRAIRAASHVVAVISSASIRHGGWAQREIQLALDHVGTLAEPRRFLIAVVLEEEAREAVGELDERLASWLEDIVWVALWRDRTRQLNGIARAVDAAARLETHYDNRGVDWAMAEVRAAQRTTRPLCLGIFAPPGAARSVFREELIDALARESGPVQRLAMDEPLTDADSFSPTIRLARVLLGSVLADGRTTALWEWARARQYLVEEWPSVYWLFDVVDAWTGDGPQRWPTEVATIDELVGIVSVTGSRFDIARATGEVCEAAMRAIDRRMSLIVDGVEALLDWPRPFRVAADLDYVRELLEGINSASSGRLTSVVLADRSVIDRAMQAAGTPAAYLDASVDLGGIAPEDHPRVVPYPPIP